MAWTKTRLLVVLTLTACPGADPAPVVAKAGAKVGKAVANKTAAPRKAAVRVGGARPRKLEPASSPATRPTAKLPASRTGQGQSFAAEVKLLFAVLTCDKAAWQPDAKGSKRFDRRALARACLGVRPALERQRDVNVARARPFIAKLRPAGLPTKVVYPFGGGDLVTALTTYPAAEEITTMSLEHAGDPRAVRTLSNKGLARALAVLAPRVAAFFGPTTSKSTTLMKLQRGPIPGELSFFLGALFVHGMRPVDLRYFRIEPDGRLHYLSAVEIEKLDDKRARRLSSGWLSPSHSPAFSNAELIFEPVGGGQRRVHRHIAANLSNDGLLKRPGLLKHLQAKGKISAMTKAASYLLWNDAFSLIRGYLLKHMAWMISDSTGIPPRLARAAGFEQLTYGRYRRCFFTKYHKRHDADFRALWGAQPYRRLGFRYGYPDGSGAYHMLVTRPRTKTGK